MTKQEILNSGGISVALTPNDIITLRSLRDEYRTWFLKRDVKRRDIDAEQTLETLEHILKQVG